jgi:Na+/pantothenate symporter
MLIIACLTACYLVVGGYVATAYTDFIQGLVMITGVICLIVAVLTNENVGGFSGLIQNLSKITDNGDGITGEQLTSIFGGSSFKFLCFNIMLTSFGTWGLPQMLGKFYAIKDNSAIKRGTIISTIFCLIIGCGAYFIGSSSRLILPELPAGGVDSVIPEVLKAVLGSDIPGMILMAIILILLLSASMSTLEAVVLTSASAVAVDLIPTIRKKSIKPSSQMLLTRIFCLAFVACSFIFATRNIPIIVNLMSFSWGVVSGCFIGPFIWGLFSKKITKAGAASGMIAGLLVVGVTTLIISLTDPAGFTAAAKYSPEMGVAAMAVSLITVPVVSLFTKKVDHEEIEEMFACYK